MSASTLHLETELSRSAPLSRARQFVEAVRHLARSGRLPHELAEAVEKAGAPPLVRALAKSAMAGSGLADAWRDTAGREMAEAYLRTLSNRSLLDAIAPHATALPVGAFRALVAFDAVADHAAEGDPKPVTRVNLANRDTTSVKSVGLCVLTRELIDATDGAALALFEAELANAVATASNRAVLAQAALGAIPVTPTGTALGDLAAAIEAAGDSDHYVVAATRPTARALALASDGRLPIRGGEFSPGITVIPVPADTATPRLTVIPASRCVLRDYGLRIANASHATIAMRTDPESPAQMVSMFQTDSIALLIEREHRLFIDAPAAEVL